MNMNSTAESNLNLTHPIARIPNLLGGGSMSQENNTVYKTNGIRVHRTNRKNMIKQKLYGITLALCGVVPIILEGDATAFIFLAMFFLPMIFGKQYIMTFKE